MATTLTFEHSEVTIANPGGVISTDTTWSSDIGNRIPDDVETLNGARIDFQYENILPVQAGSSQEDMYQYGVDGVKRDSRIGALAFFSHGIDNVFDTQTVCSNSYPSITYWKFWDYISTFWKLKTKNLESWFEAFWTALSEMNHKILLYANRYRDVIAPESTQTEIYDYMMSVDIGLKSAIPTPLDPIAGNAKYSFTPTSEVIALPPEANSETGDLEYVNYIPISQATYTAIYDLMQDGIDKYIVVSSKDDEDIFTYQIAAVVSSLTGDFNPSSYQNDTYAIEIHDNLGELINKDISIYITTGLSYNITEYVESIGFLRVINIETDEEIQFVEGVDYFIRDGVLEFFTLPNFDGTTYCDYVGIRDKYIYEAYGNLVGIRDSIPYNYTNTHGKTAVITSLAGHQMPDQADKAANALYGASIAAKDGSVVGLFESYEYKILSVVEGDSFPAYTEYLLTLDVEDILSYTFYNGGQILCEESNVIYNILDVVDRVSAVIKISVDSGVLTPVAGYSIYPRLINRFEVVEYTQETAEDSALVTVKFNYATDTLNALIAYVNESSEGKKFPELILYTSPYNSINHITGVRRNNDNSENIDFILFKHHNDSIVEYNDNVGFLTIPSDSGFAHTPWLTHKFLFVHHGGCEYEKYYIDSNMDTLYEQGDNISQYDLITTNVVKCDWETFPEWNTFNLFDVNNSHDEKYGALFLTAENHGSLPGQYLPVRFNNFDNRR